MLSGAVLKGRTIGQSAKLIAGLNRRTLSATAAPTAAAESAKKARQFTYFGDFEVKEGVAVIRFDGPNKMNTISAGMQGDAEKIFKELVLPNKEIKAVVFISSKPDNFIAGADIDMLKAVEDKSQLKDMTLKAHAYFEEIKKTGLPFVAAINGSCLGGGLEWAMYCDYRIATSSKKTVLGLPEVKLGLLPGMGGTYHLPKLIGYAGALDAMLTGKNIRPDKAKKMGLVDLVVDPDVLEQVAIRQAKGLVDGSVKVTKRKKDFMSKILEDTPFGRHIMFKKAKESVDKMSGGKYPSPYEIIGVMQENYGKSKKEHFQDEATRFAKLAATKESESLIGLYFGMNAVKKHDFGKPSKPVSTVAVLGAGLMGAGIAQVSVDNGKYRTLLKDKDHVGLGRGEKTIDDAFADKLKKKKMTNFEYCEKSSRLIGLHDGVESWKRHFASADLVIEAVFEDINIKHKVIKEMEEILPAHAIFASNTSAIPIGDIAKASKRPERVIGMHYFSPVPMMPLLEIIPHAGTAPEVIAAAMEVGARQGKTTMLVKDVPGFFVNRALSPYMVELSALVAEGVGLDTIDKAMKDFGFPVGPITLGDEVGLDVSHHVSKFMAKADLGDRMLGGNPMLVSKMVENGWLGRKVGKGFYMYPKDAKKGAKKELNPEMLAMLKKELNGVTSNLSKEDIQWRMASRFINEAAFCLQDGIIRSPVDGDIGAVFGVGFPPFLGGPFRLIDSMGCQKFVDLMYKFRDQKGVQFEPAQILKDYAKANKKFHPK